MREIRAGELLRHSSRPDWGLGKVVLADGAHVWVYFKGKGGTTPEGQVAQFPQGFERLEGVDGVHDTELDNLPPYEPGKFARKSTSLTFERAKTLFQRAYPLGFGDSKYQDTTGERPYKVAAHRRFVAAEPRLRVLAQSGSGDDIERALRTIYAGERGSDMMGLNLMHPRFEAPHYFDVLSGDVEYARKLLSTALAFIPAGNKATFEDYASAVESMYWKGKQSRTGRWPFFTWLPFVANPSIHIMIRPTVAIDFASVLPFHLRFESELDFGSYERVLMMSRELLARIQESELNLSKRPLDMIDLQSFMWVAMRYFDPGVLDKA